MRWLPSTARRALGRSAVADERSRSAPSLCEACSATPSATGQAARRARSFAPRINWGPPRAGRMSPPRAPFHDRGRPACGALHTRIDSWGANRSCPVVTFSPVKQVNIDAGWSKPESSPKVLKHRCRSSAQLYCALNRPLRGLLRLGRYTDWPLSLDRRRREPGGDPHPRSAPCDSRDHQSRVRLWCRVC